MFVHVKHTQATLGLSVVFATVAMVRTDRACLVTCSTVVECCSTLLKCCSTLRSVPQYAPGLPDPRPGVAVRCIKCCCTLHQGPQYASIKYRAMHQVPQYALGPWSGAVSRRSRAAARYYQLMQYQVLQYVPGPSVRRCSTLP